MCEMCFSLFNAYLHLRETLILNTIYAVEFMQPLQKFYCSQRSQPLRPKMSENLVQNACDWYINRLRHAE